MNQLPAPGALADLAAQIDAVLPQTQCTRCGYPDCRAYAQAIAEGAAAIDQCPPGGAQGVARLAALTGQAALALNARHGSEGPRMVAFVDEDWCIGCTLCLAACPTDAIVGASKKMHTVIERYCTGCELCIPVCPVDCIALDNASGSATGWAAWSAAQAQQARQRYRLRRQRMPDEAAPALSDSAAIRQTSIATPQADIAARQASIATAMQRARQRRPAGPR